LQIAIFLLVSVLRTCYRKSKPKRVDMILDHIQAYYRFQKEARASLLLMSTGSTHTARGIH